MNNFDSEPRHARFPRRTTRQHLGKSVAAVGAAGLMLAIMAGCAQLPPTDRDLNAEAIKQMSYWGGEPGF